MKDGFTSAYDHKYLQMIGCISADSQDALAVGFTRMGETADFVDMLLQDWTAGFDRAVFRNVSNPKPLLSNRFCTYAEYESLYNPPKKEQWREPVFRLLAIDNEQQLRAFQRSYPRSRDNYFRLMATIHPQMWSFFFQGISTRRTTQRA